MARVTLDLPADVSIALRRAAKEMDVRREDAAVVLLREALTGLGHLEPLHQLDEDTETSGSA